MDSGDRPSCHCHFHPDLVAVRRDTENDALAAINENLGEEEHASEVGDGGFCRYLDGLDQSDIGPIVAKLALIRLRVGDPHEVSTQLGQVGIEASPVHALGFLGHAGFRGSEFEDTDEVHPEVPATKGDRVIAVVDSGLAPEEDLPDWMRRPSVLYERPQDTDILTHKHPVSHGTFVTSIVRRIAPEHVVSMASARPDPGYMVTSEPSHAPAAAAQPTDELNVFGAIVRLVDRHRRDEVVALNLSLGAHDCPHDGGVFLLSTKIALEYWRENFPECEIFAAGGNSLCEEKVYPAAWDGIRAVGAAAEGGDGVVWDNGSPVPDPGRGWITDWAPGSDILGLSGRSSVDVGRWSGSSFACAVASACFASNVNRVTVNKVTWWTDQSVSYGSVPNLEP